MVGKHYPRGSQSMFSQRPTDWWNNFKLPNRKDLAGLNWHHFLLWSKSLRYRFIIASRITPVVKKNPRFLLVIHCWYQVIVQRYVPEPFIFFRFYSTAHELWIIQRIIVFCVTLCRYVSGSNSLLFMWIILGLLGITASASNLQD